MDSLKGTRSNLSSNSIDSVNGDSFARVNYNFYSNQINSFLIDRETEIQTEISTKAYSTIEFISTVLRNIDARLLVAMKKYLVKIDGFQNKYKFLQIQKNCINSTRDGVALGARVKQFTCLINNFDIDDFDLSQIAQHENHLQALKTLAQADIIIPVQEWIANSSTTIDYFTKNYMWYSFLNDLFEFFTRYDVQKNVNIYNVANLTYWQQHNKPQGLIINQNNFDDFLKRIRRDTQFEPNSKKIDELNQIINCTLKSQLESHCDNDLLEIKGNFVKSSDIKEKLMECPSKTTLKSIYIYAANMFYVDCDLYLNKTIEIELNIFAPTWNVQQASTFYLNGIDGEPHPPLNRNGLAGRPGNMGTNAGSFFGFANDVINIEELAIELNGGNGGTGQDGTGNPSIDVTFDKTHLDGKLDMFTDPDNHYRRYFRENTDYDAELMESKQTYIYVLYGASDMWHKFRLHSKHCCGSTGVGGDGKTKNFFTISD